MTSRQEDSLHRMNFEQNMTYKIHWLQRAAKDFDDIYLYYKQVAGDSVAQRRMSKILQATNNLRHLPNIGPLDEDFKHTPSYRYLFIGVGLSDILFHRITNNIYCSNMGLQTRW